MSKEKRKATKRERDRSRKDSQGSGYTTKKPKGISRNGMGHPHPRHAKRARLVAFETREMRFGGREKDPNFCVLS